jgi:predicted NACHT family NTPase
MAVVQPPNELRELERVDEMLLRELERVDEILLEELERVDELLVRIVSAIDQLPERIASASTREPSSESGNGTKAAGSARGRASTRPFDPYGEDELEAAEDKGSAARQVARKVHSWVAAYAPDRGALRFATVSLAVAWLATSIAVLALIFALFH